MHSLKPAHVSAATSSLLSIQEFSAIEDVLNSIAQQVADEVTVAAPSSVCHDIAEAIPVGVAVLENDAALIAPADSLPNIA